MTLEYDRETHIRELEPILDQYAEWFMQVVRRIFYPGLGHESKPVVSPDSFTLWMEAAEEKKLMEPQTLENLGNLHKDLAARAEKLLSETLRTQKPPAYDDFDKLATFFEEFIHYVRRITKDYLVGDTGVDVLTGLRSRDMFYKDVQREMDRLARQGKAFSLAVARIDRFDRLRQNLAPQDLESCLKTVAAVIKKSIRSFDDAYRMDDGFFSISLKQTGTQGGMKALNRMKSELEKSKVSFKTKEGELYLSLSSCIAEPLPDDDIRLLLNNLKADLDMHHAQVGAVLEYMEMSELQRLVKEGRE